MSQQGVISDSPITTPFERIGEVSTFSFFNNSKFGRTLHRHWNDTARTHTPLYKGVISDSPITPLERVGEVSRF